MAQNHSIVTLELPDDEELEEMHAVLRDYMRASDVAALLELDEAAALEGMTAMFGVVRHMSEAIGGLALVLRRQPPLAERIADELDELAAALDDLMYVSLDEAEQDERQA